MKRSLLVLSSLIAILAFLVLPASSALAQSNVVAHQAHQTRPLTSPSCFGDGLPNSKPPIQPCDGLNSSICNVQYLENVKAIGSSDGEGQIGQLQTYYSPTNGNGCNAWHEAIYITHTGCYNVISEQLIESGADNSFDGWGATEKLCKGQYDNSRMAGDYQPGGCYYATSEVDDASLNGQNTVGATFCYQGTH